MSDPFIEKATQIVLAMASALLLHDSDIVRELYDGINQSIQGRNQPISDSVVDRMAQSGIIHMDSHNSTRHEDRLRDDSYEEFRHSGTVNMPSGSRGSRSTQQSFHYEKFAEPLASSTMIDRTSMRKSPDESHRSFAAQLAPIRLSDIKALTPSSDPLPFKTLPETDPGRHYLQVPQHLPHMRNPNISGRSPRSPRTQTALDDLNESINMLVQRIHRQADIMLSREQSADGRRSGSIRRS
ncbi:uncharacterized protein LOC110674442 [Aedes aegypti]|uniref:Uncharacterized protein n=1 Tax=Aedes aegypti TaxID=7159 RepID=A0A6I8U903_AEDAE|nr:uncharacterized protein LOC110674442 [Aedes aegypti]